MCIPFAWANPKVESLSSMDVDWIGKVKPEEYWSYLDYGLLLIFGGIPWQVYFQRVLSSKTAGRAQILSYVAAVGCILMAIPPVLIGAIAKATREYHTFNYRLINWNGRLISLICHAVTFFLIEDTFALRHIPSSNLFKFYFKHSLAFLKKQ